MIRVFLHGEHAIRSPLSYPALAPLFAQDITLTARPEDADLYVFSHKRDIVAAPEAMILDWRRRRRPVVLLSEEPFWDSIWGREPLQRHVYVDTALGGLPVIQINHQTSDLFRFKRLPYYLLTNHRFANVYRHRFARNAALSQSDWRAAFDDRHLQVSYMFERRPEPYHAMGWPEGDLQGLCSWRTELATACHGPVERLGRSWHGGPSRFEIRNWHLEKIVQLDGRARLMGALENTHQPQYITEKLFDAFACGSLPLYFASPGHRIHDLGLPPESWVNLFGLSPTEAAEKVMTLQIGPAQLEAFRDAQSVLKDLLSDMSVWQQERARLRQALLRELEQVLEGAGASL